MKAGAEWQMSIGANADEYRRVEAEEKININGQELAGPLYVITKSTLREVSVVAVGADASTNMKIEAKLNLTSTRGEGTMPENNKKYLYCRLSAWLILFLLSISSMLRVF